MALSIRKGDEVLIKAQGTSRQGIVHSASNYGNRTPEDPPCWYIEMLDPTHGEVYWKQDADGGTVVNLSVLYQEDI